MKLALTGLVTYVAATCTEDLLAGLADPGFSWLVSGTVAQRKANVTVICASDVNDAKTNFNTRLTSITTACAPAGAAGQVSAFGLTSNLLNTVLCEKKGDDYCLLSMLPLFDMSYFVSLSQADYKSPPLQPVADSPERQAAMCAAPLCNAYIENMASSLLANLPDTNETDPAASFVRATVSRMRCGCAVMATPCAGTTATNELIVDNSGVKTLIESKACDTNGVLTACARTWVNCESVSPPACARSCNDGILSTIVFRIKNLNWACAQSLLSTDTLRTIRNDVIANVPGLLHTDFSCECGAATAPSTGTQCSCTINCLPLALVKNLNLTGALALLKAKANALVIPTPHIDGAARSCQLSPNLLSFGSSFELVSVQSNFPTSEPSSSSTLVVGLSVAATVSMSLFL